MLRLMLFSCLMWPALALAVEQFTYRVLETKPHDRSNYVQGLEIHDDLLYVSAGEYGKSRLLRYAFGFPELQIERRLHPAIFAEGLTVFGDKIYLLTWRERIALVFSRTEMELLEVFPIQGQGWGLTNNGRELIYTDGSDRLHYLDPKTRKITRSIGVTENGLPLHKLNELEWIDGSIWANIYQTDRIVIIEPESGKVTASIDLEGLFPHSKRRDKEEVLNGIARNPADGAIWVTGKRWPQLFRIELIPREEPPAKGDSR